MPLEWAVINGNWGHVWSDKQTKKTEQDKNGKKTAAVTVASA